MINKNIYLETLKVAQDVSKKYNISNICDKIYSIMEEVEEFKVRVLFVGSFNAGKSALINTFIDEDLLKEKQAPETTIATEVIYGQPKRAVLCDKRGNKKSIPIDEVGSYNAEEYFNYTYYIPNENLLNVSDYIMVDMPGFDSGIAAHNRALLQYVGLGTVYIFVVDCETGTLTQNALNFLKEIKSYDNKIAFAINKCEKKIPSDIESIKKKITQLSKISLQEEVKVITTSKFDENTPKKLENLINSFDVQDLFKKKYLDKTKECLKDIILALEKILNSSQFDDKAFEDEIMKKESAKNSLLDKLDCERKKLHNDLQNNVKESLLNDIRDALYSNSLILANSAVTGGENFSRAVNDILRPILMQKTSKYIDESFSGFVRNFEINEISNGINSEEIGDILITFSNKLKKFIKTGTKGTSAYKSITTILAVTTSVVSPWVEVVLIFLPDIIKLFEKISGTNQIDAFKNKIENEVIPNILKKIEPDIEQSLMEIEEQMVAELENQINDLIEIETQALGEIKRRKMNEEEEYKNMLKDIKKDINDTKDLMEKL